MGIYESLQFLEFTGQLVCEWNKKYLPFTIPKTEQLLGECCEANKHLGNN